MFTARAGENVPIPVKALESQEASWPRGVLLDSLIHPKVDLQSVKQDQAGKRNGLADTLPRVQGTLGIRDQFTSY